MKNQPVKTLKETPKDDAQKERELVKLLAAGTAVLTIVEDVVPKLNKLVEDNIAIISDSFSKIAVTSKAMGRFFELSNTDVKPMITELEKNIGTAIMGMQFQDRLSQNMVIIKNISEILNNAAKDAINLQQAKNGAASAGLNIDLAKKILENLKLGEVREVYINYLIQVGLIKDASDLGYHATEEVEKKAHEDDIELF